MKIQYLFLTLFLAICFSSTAQSDTFQAGIINYLDNTGVRAQYDEAYEEMFLVLARNFKNTEIMEEDWTTLSKDKEETIDEAMVLLSAAYRKHFSKDDISAMTEFYNSEAALQQRRDPTALSPDQQDQINAFYDGEIGRKIENAKNELATDLTKISEEWARDLFGAKMTQLVKMGYRNQ
jgi:Skp family chaperone for outer membrane proteins